MTKKKNPLTFMDVSVDGDPIERMVFELFYDVAPKTAENFRALCTGESGISQNTGKSLNYKGSFFHQIIKGSIVKGGDFVNRNGTGGESIYGSNFPDESPTLKHDSRGLLSMAIADRDTLGSHFIITLKADHHLDRKHVVFGKIVQGHNVLKKIEEMGDEEGSPTVIVKIINCGEYSEGDEEGSSEANSHDARRKGKQKEFSKDKRKKRRYYTSESGSSSDFDLESLKIKVNKSKIGGDGSSEANSHEARRKGKQKESSKDNRKRTRYSSESESSSDLDKKLSWHVEFLDSLLEYESNSQETRRKGELKKTSKDRRKRRKYYLSKSGSSSDSDKISTESNMSSSSDCWG